MLLHFITVSSISFQQYMINYVTQANPIIADPRKQTDRRSNKGKHTCDNTTSILQHQKIN